MSVIDEPEIFIADPPPVIFEIFLAILEKIVLFVRKAIPAVFGKSKAPPKSARFILKKELLTFKKHLSLLVIRAIPPPTK